jgi:hypothetical protein
MTDVPDQLVIGRVEDIVQGDRQLDYAEAGAEMAAGDRDRVDSRRAVVCNWEMAGVDDADRPASDRSRIAVGWFIR